jgi:hypothetical protein
MYKTKKHGIPLSCIVSLVFPILGMVSACNTYKNCIGYEIPYGRMKEAARLDDKQFCIILTDSNSVEKYKNTIIAGMEDCGRTLWSFINIDNPDNNWYKWLLGVWNSPFTLIFDKNGQLENIVFGISEYARMSIESTVSPHNEDEGIRHKNFGFRANSAVPDGIGNANKFIESHLQLIADTTETYYGKFLKADSLAMIAEYPFSEYLKLHYGSHVFSKDSIAKMAHGFIERYLHSSYPKITYSSLIQTISKMFLLENAESPLKLETHIAKGPYHIGDEANITVSVTNNGHENITIEKIETTCGCIKTLPAGRHFRKTIRQNETVNYRFSMELEYSGTIYHEIYFYFHTGNAASLATAGIELNVEQ